MTLLDILGLSMFLVTTGDPESTAPLLKDNRFVSASEEQSQKPRPAENLNLPADGTQDRTDTVIDQKEELHDLSVLKST